jgi:hypothetical protein
MSSQYDHEWLKARTIHIKGIPLEDTRGEGLQVLINRYLDNTKMGGKVLGFHMVPDFHTILGIEEEI